MSETLKKIEKVHSRVAAASGTLIYMIVKRRLRRSKLEECRSILEEALQALNELSSHLDEG